MPERFDPSPAFKPQAHWEKMPFGSTSNVWKVTAPGGTFFAKDDAGKVHGPHALHADAAASEALHAVGLGDHVPPAAVAHKDGRSLLLTPWLEGFAPARDAVHASARRMSERAVNPTRRSRAREVLKGHRDSGRLADLLAGEWLVSDGDRHANNYLYHPGDGRLLSVDHDRAWLDWQNAYGLDYSKPPHSELTKPAFHEHPGHAPTPQDRISHDTLRKMWDARHHLTDILESRVAPHMEPGAAEGARAVLADKLAHVRRLLELPNPSLWHLNAHGTDDWREFERAMNSRTPRAGE
jgi:hypothetical protein